MSADGRKKALRICVIAGIIAIILVVLKAHAAEVMCDNNKLIAENKALQGEVDTLDIKIKSANNVEHIEEVARDNLGMVYSDENSCIYLSDRDVPDGNLAMTMKENAYS